MKVFWNLDYASSKYAFDTTRKSQNIVNILNQEKHAGIEIADPNDSVEVSIVEKLIADNLNDDYVRALRTGQPTSLSRSQGFDWDENIYPMARAHTHGLVASVNEVTTGGGRAGSLSSGLHHASQSSGMGFCTINGIALSAIYAAENGHNTLILDFDAHCGGGTMKHIYAHKNITQIDVSTNSFDMYSGFSEISSSQSDSAIGSTRYVDGLHLLIKCNDGNKYMDCIERALHQAEKLVDDKTLVIYNAGIDVVDTRHIDEEVVAQREHMVSEWIDGKPAIFALAGGYSSASRDRDSIAKTHILNIVEWAEYGK